MDSVASFSITQTKSVFSLHRNLLSWKNDRKNSKKKTKKKEVYIANIITECEPHAH